MQDYTKRLESHRADLAVISQRSYRAATIAARGVLGCREYTEAHATWRADCAAEVVAGFYFYDSYTGVKRI